jgi:UDPglucose 6-dehydrogenase
MHIGVYGSGYLATVISACLADFGTPVCSCHADSSQIVEVSKGNIPFYEKNLQEVIRRNVRSGRLVYSIDPGDLARKAQVIFLAEDSPQGLEELVLRMAGSARGMQVLSVVTPVRVGTTGRLEEALKKAGLRSQLVCQPMFFTNGCAVEDFNWPDRIVLGCARAGHQLRNRGTGAGSGNRIRRHQDLFHQ